MIGLRAPDAGEVRSFVEAHAAAPLTYDEVGMADADPPSGWSLDHHRVLLGAGEETFSQAVAALRSWAMLPGWVRAHPPGPPVTGGVVAVTLRRLGVVWVAPCRVVRLIDQPDRVGFAWGTLEGHPLAGEERFLVERGDGGEVWYDLRAVSRPGRWWLRAGRGRLRDSQRRFARDSLDAMQQAVGSG